MQEPGNEMMRSNGEGGEKSGFPGRENRGRNHTKERMERTPAQGGLMQPGEQRLQRLDAHRLDEMMMEPGGHAFP